MIVIRCHEGDLHDGDPREGDPHDEIFIHDARIWRKLEAEWWNTRMNDED